ncbi:hypothetical protein DY000_02043837 [Brassica cretica]|uniref:60S ribosomal protein L39 n=1 Tax=Brassica cretica TaxID=69181 RepID=A0ABQ7B5W4_BRACR|nr:hypothetical protein DY000_02043837 [Brassica cretica]
MPSHKSFMIKKNLAKKMRQNRPIPHWIRLRTDNTIRYTVHCQAQALAQNQARILKLTLKGGFVIVRCDRKDYGNCEKKERPLSKLHIARLQDAVPQVVYDKEESGQEDEAKQAYSPLDSSSNRQHYQVHRTLPSAGTGAEPSSDSK